MSPAAEALRLRLPGSRRAHHGLPRRQGRGNRAAQTLPQALPGALARQQARAPGFAGREESTSELTDGSCMGKA